MSYLNITEVESALVGLASTYPSICELITLPNASIEGRTSHAVRIGTTPATSRDGVLLTGGVHAREWGSSEICVSLAADLCEAFTNSLGLSYGGKSFSVAEVQSLVVGLNWFVFADANPDGRDFSQNSDAMWRRNRNPLESGGNADCIGVDLNRNHDFLWDFPNLFSSSATINTSANPCSASQTYRGSAAASEPETQNVVWLLDTFPRIRWYVDLHSSGEMILHSWGDDDNQSTDSSKNFTNPAFNTTRGVGGDSAYGEFIPADDLTESTTLANTMHDAIQAVRGTDYSVGPAFDLYGTSGANDDYAYSRHFADATKGKVIAYTVEWGTEFQPPWSEMQNIVQDVSAGLLAFASKAICLVESVVDLDTPTITFNDVPEGETTARSIVFSVARCGTSTFQIISGPTTTSGPGSFGTLPSPTQTLPSVTSSALRHARLWLSFQGQTDGDNTAGSVTVQLVETGEQWVIPITANTIARPTVAVALVLDQSGSMTEPSGVPAFPTRNDALKFAAPVFVNVLPEGDGVGVVDFDQDAYDRMIIKTVGAPGAFDVVRAEALTAIAAHTPNINGATAIGDGVEHAHNLLDPATGFENKAMVVFTDGFETSDKYIADVAPLINDSVFAIGLGTADQVQPNALVSLTNGSGGYLLLTGDLGNTDLFRLSKYYLQVLAGVTNHDIVLDPDGYVLPGQVVRIPFRLNEADIETDVILLSDWPPQAFVFALETPAGDFIDPSAAGVLGGQFVTGNGVSYYRLTLPVALGSGAHAGKWNAIIAINPRYTQPRGDYASNNPKLPANGLRYSLSVHSYSGIRLVGSVSQSSNEPGAVVTVRGVMSEYGIPINSDRVHITAEIERPDGTTSNQDLTEVSNGVFETSFNASQSGVYPLRLLAKGKSLRGRLFTREHLLTAATWKGGDQPPPTHNNSTKPGDKICELIRCIKRAHSD